MNPEQVERNVMRLQEPGALTAALNWYRALSLDLRLDSVAVPTLYIWGEDDMALGRTAAEETARFVSGPYQFVALPGRSHWLMHDAVPEVTGLLLAHLHSVAWLPSRRHPLL